MILLFRLNILFCFFIYQFQYYKENSTILVVCLIVNRNHGGPLKIFTKPSFYAVKCEPSEILLYSEAVCSE